jgi:hypothetical protein
MWLGILRYRFTPNPVGEFKMVNDSRVKSCGNSPNVQKIRPQNLVQTRVSAILHRRSHYALTAATDEFPNADAGSSVFLPQWEKQKPNTHIIAVGRCAVCFVSGRHSIALHRPASRRTRCIRRSVLTDGAVCEHKNSEVANGHPARRISRSFSKEKSYRL